MNIIYLCNEETLISSYISNAPFFLPKIDAHKRTLIELEFYLKSSTVMLPMSDVVHHIQAGTCLDKTSSSPQQVPGDSLELGLEVGGDFVQALKREIF